MTDVAERRFGGGWDWPDWSQQDLVRRGRLQSVIWPALFMFCLVEPVTSAFGGHRPAAFRFGVLALVLVFAAVYLLVNWYSPRSSPLARTLLIGSLALFPVALALLQGPEQLIYFTYFVSPALIFLPRNVGALLGVACAA